MHPHGHGLNWVVVDDANGVLLHGQTDEHTNEDGTYDVWVYNNKASGFGDTVGQIQLHKLKKDPHTGHYVA